MKELIDVKNHIKMMAMILCGIRYKDQDYLLYSIQRNSDEVNIFVSKLLITSSGYTISHEFDNGEKDALEKVIQRFLSKENLQVLEKEGFSLIKNIELVDKNYFDIELCYVTTLSKSFIKDYLIFYDLFQEDKLQSPVVNVVESKKKLENGFVGNIFLIVFGIFVVVFSVSIVISVFFR